MRAFWTIRMAVQNTAGMWGPDLPPLANLRVVCPGDVNRLGSGTAPADHVHVIAGGVALASEQAGGNHEHYVVFHNGNWVQQVRGTAPAHTHPANDVPDFFLCFVTCDENAFAALIASGVRVIAEAQMENGVRPLGLVDVPWTDIERTFWAALALNQMGIALPAVVDRGARLVSLLLGLFLSRRLEDDGGLR